MTNLNQCKILDHYFLADASICTCGVLRRNINLDNKLGYRRPATIQSTQAKLPTGSEARDER